MNIYDLPESTDQNQYLKMHRIKLLCQYCIFLLVVHWRLNSLVRVTHLPFLPALAQTGVSSMKC